MQSLTTTDDRVIVMSYSRKTLQQTGDGHFAPVGGYHPQRDLILVMDVAKVQISSALGVRAHTVGGYEHFRVWDR